MSEVEQCPECGQPLRESSPGALCPTCLMKRAFLPTESETGSGGPLLSTTFIPTAGPEPQAGTTDKPIAGDLPAGQLFGDYRIVRRLGHGGMGTVYEADHLPSGRRVALKVLSHSLDSQEARSRFLREGRLAAAINHANSVYVFGTEEIGGIPTISMELIAGGTLASQVDKFGPMPVQQAVDSILQVIAGLEAAEQKGVLHRDVKPANCFVDRNGQVKIGDFGLSISTAPTDLSAMSNMTQEGVFLGTPAFASPEQLRGEQLDQRSDIYAVGVTLFYLLTGKPPFEGKNLVQLLATVLDKSAPSVHDRNPEVPAALSRVIESCLAKSSGSRPFSYAALRERLTPFGSQTPISASLEQRFLAGLLDVFVISLVTLLARAILFLFISPFESNRLSVYGTVIAGVIAVTYFAICESRFGATPGKRILGLRVSATGRHPSFASATLRALIYDATTRIPFLIGAVIVLVKFGNETNVFNASQAYFKTQQAVGFLYYFGFVLTAALFLPMWRSRDKTAFHDRLTGTRVTLVPPIMIAAQHNQLSQPDEAFVAADSSQTIGPYVVLAMLNEDEGESTLLAYDPKLLRRVWIRTRADNSPAISNADRNVARPGRLRWLGGQRGSENWDCYEAPSGHGLTGHIQLGWENGRQLIQSLTQELECSLEERTLPATLSLQNLWANTGDLKLLPFRAPDCSTDRREETIVTHSSRSDQESACIRFVAMLAQHVMKPLAADETTTVPLSCRPKLIGLWNSESLLQTRQIADRLQEGHATVSRTRRLILLLITFSLPISWGLSGLLSYMLLNPQYNAFPRVGELSNAIQTLNVQKKRQHQRRAEEHAKLMSAIKTYIAHEYRDVYNDTAQWNSPRAKSHIGPEDRALIKSLMAEPEPTPAEFAAAKDVSERFFVTVTVGRSSAFNETLFNMAQWAVFFWIPSLLAAISLRGGWLVRSLGVAFADCHGEPASRLRLLWRAFLPGIPFLVALGCSRIERGPQHGFSFLFAEWSSVGFAVVGILLLVWTAKRTRFLSDSLSGCYLVPR